MKYAKWIFLAWTAAALLYLAVALSFRDLFPPYWTAHWNPIRVNEYGYVLRALREVVEQSFIVALITGWTAAWIISRQAARGTKYRGIRHPVWGTLVLIPNVFYALVAVTALLTPFSLLGDTDSSVPLFWQLVLSNFFPTTAFAVLVLPPVLQQVAPCAWADLAAQTGEKRRGLRRIPPWLILTAPAAALIFLLVHFLVELDLQLAQPEKQPDLAVLGAFYALRNGLSAFVLVGYWLSVLCSFAVAPPLLRRLVPLTLRWARPR